ncbi:butyrophilin subfamily 1 member A1-like [Tachyglossus aculeatus]|uniref:butyrophilin subfamily 1 member A1-like n=1 Tax=Tachyglossus aculeatus TaxID=9261 RepID=UPI0018F3F7D5|nr:butyrophilin subfamily 1 member A1-like [Tachyglossus aculeatus]
METQVGGIEGGVCSGGLVPMQHHLSHVLQASQHLPDPPLGSSKAALMEDSSLPSPVLFLLILQVFPWSSALSPGEFKVMGPTEPILAWVGEEAQFSCQLTPLVDAKDMLVKWYRGDSTRLVHVYHEGRTLNDEVMPEYQNRTKMEERALSDGILLLTVNNVRPSDQGDYTCSVDGSTNQKGFTIRLNVAAMGSDPQISVEGHVDGRILLECKSEGWYPEPEVQWKDNAGNNLLSSSESTDQGEDKLFWKKASLLITEKDERNLSCLFWNPILGQKLDSKIHVADFLFLKRSPWSIILGVLLTVLILLIGLAQCFLWSHNKLQISKTPTADIGWRRLHAVMLTLDPDTAHPQLELSNDHHTMILTQTWRDVPRGHRRFNVTPAVLGSPSFTSGRRYWEVEVGDGAQWILGVCREGANMQGKVSFNPQNGYWAMWLKKGNGNWILESPFSLLPLVKPPQCVGIFLDYSSGLLSFYSTTDMVHLYTFPHTLFHEHLFPFFSLCANPEGESPASLTVCPIEVNPTGVPKEAPQKPPRSLEGPGSIPGESDALLGRPSSFLPV